MTDRSGTLWVVAVLGLVGAGVSALSLMDTYRYHADGLLATSACNLATWLDCRAALASEHGFVLGAPVSLLSLIFFAWCAVCAALALRARSLRRRLWKALWVAGAPASLFALHRAAVMALDVRILCPSCLVLQGATLLTAWLAARGVGIRPGAALASLAHRSTRAMRQVLRSLRAHIGRVEGAALAALVLGTVSTFLLMQDYMLSAQEIKTMEALDRFYRRRVHTLTVPPDAAQLGRRDAPVRIVLLTDFACMWCRRAARRLEPHMEDVRVDILLCPLGKSDAAAPGAVAARGAVIAARHGVFRSYARTLFRRPEMLSRERIERWLVERGLPRHEVRTYLEGDAADAVLDSHAAFGRALAVDRTPTLYIGGRRMGGYNGPMLDLVIEQELRLATARKAEVR